MKYITVSLNDGNEVTGKVIRENDDESEFLCIDDNGLMFEVQITVED